MIKKTILFVFVALLLTGNNLYGQKITLGIKGIGSISNLSRGKANNTSTFGSSKILGAGGGAYAEYHVSKLFSVSAGAEYSSQWGIKETILFNTINNTNNSYLSEIKLDYLAIPILARVNWKSNKRSPVKYYAALGPFAGYLVTAKNGLSQLQNPTPAANTVSKLNAGLQGLVGVYYSLDKKNAVFIEGGGNYGILPIQNKYSRSQKYTASGFVAIGYAYTLQQSYRSRCR